MRRAWLVLCCCFGLLGQACGPSGGSAIVDQAAGDGPHHASGWDLQLALSTESFSRPEDVVLEVRLINRGRHAATAIVDHPMLDYTALLTSQSDGRPLPLSRDGTALVERLRDGASPEFMEVPGGSDWRVDLRLAEYFEITQPASYSFVLRGEVVIHNKDGSESKTAVQSNVVSFHVRSE